MVPYWQRRQAKAYRTVRILMYYRRRYHERGKLLLQAAAVSDFFVDPKAAGSIRAETAN